MHELHLVRALVAQIEQHAASHHARRIKTVKIRFNPLTSHSADHVQFSFDVVKKEVPLLKDAALILTEVAPLVRCRQCNHQFEARQLPDECPRCRSMDLQPENPTELSLEEFEAEF